MNTRDESDYAVHVAITRLASLYPFGALQANAVPAQFLGEVADEVEQLRGQRARLLAHLRQWLELHGTPTSQLAVETRALLASIEAGPKEETHG